MQRLIHRVRRDRAGRRRRRDGGERCLRSGHELAQQEWHSDREQQQDCSAHPARSARCRWLVVSQDKILSRRIASQFAIRAIDLGRTDGISAFPIGMMQLDQALVGALDRGVVSIRLEAKCSVGGRIAHRRGLSSMIACEKWRE